MSDLEYTDGATAASRRTESLTQSGITLLDGGTGSELRRRGVRLSDVTWSATANIDQADILTAIHRDYIDAGADVITANTFAATRFVLDAAELADRFEAFNRTAIVAALRARSSAPSDRRIMVAASLSCYPPANDPTRYPDRRDELEAYRESIRIFERAGAELVLLEMMQETEHAPLACQAAAECKLPFWLGLSCRRDASTGRLVSFDPPAADFGETLRCLLEFGPAAVNVMHSPLDVVDAALALVRRRWSGTVGAYPAIPYAEDPEATSPATKESPPVTAAAALQCDEASGRHVSAADDSPISRAGSSTACSPAGLASHAAAWLDAGATIIGGCCGTTPPHVAALRQLIDERTARDYR